MKPPLVLVVDDEEDLTNLLVYQLEKNNYQTLKALCGRDALRLAKKFRPALILLDLMLPDLDGFEVYRMLRQDEATAAIPVIMLTAKAEEIDRVLGLELGADDYVTKPFSNRELVLRVRSVLRRTHPTEPEEKVMAHRELKLNPDRFEVTVGSERVVLTYTEFKLLQELLSRRGRVLTRNMLLQNVWGYLHNVTDRTVDTHVKRLRQKLGRAAEYIETIRGIGYRFQEAPEGGEEEVRDGAVARP
ncbi:MAG: response regulator transcription factor [bacterium]